MMTHSIRRKTLFVLLIFGGLTAVAGGIGLLTEGIPASPDWLHGSPFHDYTVPALSLMILVGGSMLLAAAMILSGREAGVLVSAVAGGAMMIFELVEVVVIDRQSGNNLLLALVLQTFYFLLGLVICVLAVSLWMAEFRQRHVPARSGDQI